MFHGDLTREGPSQTTEKGDKKPHLVSRPESHCDAATKARLTNNS